MITKAQKKIYLLNCLNQHYLIFRTGATVLDCAMWLNCSKPTAQSYLEELFNEDLVSVEIFKNRRIFKAKNVLETAHHQTYLDVRRFLKGF